MDHDDLLAFDAERQAEHEADCPAEIRIGAAGDVLAAAGGNVRQLDRKLMPGGFLGEFDLLFRVRKALFTTPPDVGVVFSWRRKGEEVWRGPASIMRLTDPTNSVAYMIYGGNPTR